MRGALRVLLIAALSAVAVVASEEAAEAAPAPTPTPENDQAARSEAIRAALANATLPAWMDTKAQHRALCCSLAKPGYEKQLLNCVRRNGPMPVGVTAEEETDGYSEDGKRARQKKALDGSGRILVLMEVRRELNSSLHMGPDDSNRVPVQSARSPCTADAHTEAPFSI